MLKLCAIFIVSLLLVGNAAAQNYQGRADDAEDVFHAIGGKRFNERFAGCHARHRVPRKRSGSS